MFDDGSFTCPSGSGAEGERPRMKIWNFIVKLEGRPLPEMFAVIPQAHASSTTDRALAWLPSEEDAR